jgi:carbon monoxide dehydrogenase subunit G
MATVHTEITIEAPADAVWAVIGDFADGPKRMAPGFVLDSHLLDTDTDASVRKVSFAGGAVVQERLIAVDDEHRRIVYSVVGGTVRPEHDNAAMQVLPDGEGRSRFVWTRDVLPDELAAPMGSGMRDGCAHIKRTLDTR